MKAIEQLDRLQKMNKLIREESTGTPEEFAACLGVSLSHLHRCIEEIKNYGAPISFNRIRRTYYYKRYFNLEVKYSIHVVSEDFIKKIYGGSSPITISL